jgi:curved DNA-binding protein
MKDFYSILGVARDASADEIKTAYRRLAGKHHPDRGGDTARFQEIQEAYSVLGDAAKRQQYDHPQSRFAEPPGFDFEGIYDMFGARFGNFHRQRQTYARIELWISLRDVAQGGPRTLSVSSPAGQSNIEITIPAGIEDGFAMRYPKIAPGGVDLVVHFRVHPEPGWQRNGADVIHDFGIDIWDLLLGTTAEVTTLSGASLSLTVPPKTQPDQMLRVRGHGLPTHLGTNRGDLYIKFLPKWPSQISEDLLEHIQRERSR